MKLNFKLIRILVLVIIGGLLLTQTPFLQNIFLPHRVEAAGDLSVDWGIGIGDVGPIFSITTMTPGQSEVRTVTVTNGASTTRPIGIRGLNLTQTNNLATVFDIKISKNSTDIYGGTMGNKTVAQFITESTNPNGIFLTNLNAGSSTQFVITVTFQEAAGNEFQQSMAEFDIQFGVSVEVPLACQNITFAGNPIIGTQKSDKLTGTPGNDLIFGLEGHDHITGNGGNDCIVGGVGRDHLDGNNGDDILIGENDDDALYGNNGNDTLLAGNGRDQLKGENGNDYLDAGAGDDSLEGGNDNDDMHAGAGRDSVKGANGNDTLFGDDNDDNLDGGAGDDSLTGGNGTDRADGRIGIDTCLAEVEKSCEL
jgi:Ca2+-binding RTX toxin-like protein